VDASVSGLLSKVRSACVLNRESDFIGFGSCECNI
jgi:hypothetical protein